MGHLPGCKRKDDKRERRGAPYADVLRGRTFVGWEMAIETLVSDQGLQELGAGAEGREIKVTSAAWMHCFEDLAVFGCAATHQSSHNHVQHSLFATPAHRKASNGNTDAFSK